MEFNYSELLAFDRASSVTRTKSESARKLAAWADRLTEADYPTTWEIDNLDGTVVTLTEGAGDGVLWTGTGYRLNIEYTNGVVTRFHLTDDDAVTPVTLYDVIAVEEGFLTLDNGVRINLVDPDVRSGDDNAVITYEDVPRAAIIDELDAYVHSRLNRLEDEEIKGHTLDGVWRLSEMRKGDSDDPDSTTLTLIYKRGYAKILGVGVVFPEAVLMNKKDFQNDSSKLIIKFPNMDSRYVETAKAPYLIQETITDPVFGGIVYDGTWMNIVMTSSEFDMGGSVSEASSVIWELVKSDGEEVAVRAVVGDRIRVTTIAIHDKTPKEINAYMESTICTTDGRILQI